MKFFLKILFTAAVAFFTAESGGAPNNEIMIGPVTVSKALQGVPVNASATTFFSLRTENNTLFVDARLEANLQDLRYQFGSLFGTIPLPTNNCASKTLNNIVAHIPSRDIGAQNGKLVISLGGNVESWACLDNPVPETYWDPTGCTGSTGFLGHIHYKFGCPRTRSGSPIKNKNLTQPFTAHIPISIVVDGGNTIRLDVGTPDINLTGQLVFITKGVLKIGGVNINDAAKKIIDNSIDPSLLSLTIPEEYESLNPVVKDAHFGEKDGNLTLFISLSAAADQGKLNELVKGLLSVKPQNK